MFGHEVSQAQPVQAREAEEVPRSQLGGIQPRAAPPRRFDSLFDEEAIANWKADKTGKPGGQRVYSDMAIETGLVVRMVYKLAYRQTEGFLHSIALLLGLGIEIPDYSTLCRRSRLLRKKLRIPKAASNQPIHLMIDSTGLRIHVGTARKPPKQRAWRKLHIAVDRKTGTIVASELTASRARDATRVPALLTQIQAPLAWVAADSAYDKETVYEAIEAHSPGRRTRVVIPPQRNATLSQNSNTAMRERDRHIRAIERHGRREWYKLSGFTKRSMVENAVYRYKAIIGSEMRARTLARQRVEHRIGCEILNKMAALGMPIRTAPGDSATGIREVSDLLRAVQQRQRSLKRADLPSLGSHPAWIAYETRDGKRFEKAPGTEDLRSCRCSTPRRDLGLVSDVVLERNNEMYLRCALHLRGVSSIADFYTPRNLEALSLLWREISAIGDDRLRRALAFAFTNTAWHGTRMRRFNARGGHRPLTGTLYIPQLSSEANVLEVMRNKINQLRRYYRAYRTGRSELPSLLLGSATDLSSIPDASIAR